MLKFCPVAKVLSAYFVDATAQCCYSALFSLLWYINQSICYTKNKTRVCHAIFMERKLKLYCVLKKFLNLCRALVFNEENWWAKILRISEVNAFLFFRKLVYAKFPVCGNVGINSVCIFVCGNFVCFAHHTILHTCTICLNSLKK